jgi:hypothetical protein
MVQSLATIGTVGASPMNKLITPAVYRALCFLVPVVVIASIVHDLGTIPPANPISPSLAQGKVS